MKLTDLVNLIHRCEWFTAEAMLHHSGDLALEIRGYTHFRTCIYCTWQPWRTIDISDERIPRVDPLLICCPRRDEPLWELFPIAVEDLDERIPKVGAWAMSEWPPSVWVLLDATLEAAADLPAVAAFCQAVMTLRTEGRK